MESLKNFGLSEIHPEAKGKGWTIVITIAITIEMVIISLMAMRGSQPLKAL